MNQAILIVDDDVVLGQVLSRVLSRPGYNVLIAGNQAQAVQLAQEQQPAVALIDLCLPDGDGVQLAEVLRVQHPDLVLILMTAYPLRVRDNPELGRLFARVLTKPLNVKELRETIESASTAFTCP
jgi:DNA-binding response OmpR family regulator